jgi:hypothetical protein
MASSGTFNFAPSLGEIVIASFGRCGVRRTELTMQHMSDARMESNLMMSDWTADGINLWEVQSNTISLTQGTASYPIPSTVVFFLDCYITTISGINTPIDRLIFPISRSDYTALASKTQQGAPTTFWFDRLISPNLYLWPTPDQNGYYSLTYYFMRQAQDSELINGTAPEIPWYYLDAFCWGLTSRLSLYYAPDRADRLEARAMKSWMRALSVGTENVGLSIQPQLMGYFR